MKSLKTWKAKANKGCNLVFPTAGCNPKLDLLDCLKPVAERAKLDEDNFWFHKFRGHPDFHGLRGMLQLSNFPLLRVGCLTPHMLLIRPIDAYECSEPPSLLN